MGQYLLRSFDFFSIYLRPHSFWFKHPIFIVLGVSFLLTTTMMTIGILTICLTERKTFGTSIEYLLIFSTLIQICMSHLVQSCQINFKATDRPPVRYKYGPRDITIGDFNNDTSLDMVIAQDLAHEITVYLGNGQGKFNIRTSYFTGSHSSPRKVIVGHFNKDSYLDLVVANFGSNNIRIFYGFGNGSFNERQSQEIFTGISRPIALIGAYCNDDVLLDLVIVNYGTHSISVYLQDKNEQFVLKTTRSMGDDSYPSSIVAGDFNRDQHTDLAITNTGTNNIIVLFGDGTGDFIHQLMYSTGWDSHPQSIATGDLNDDHFLDIVVANFGTKTISIFLNNRNGQFTQVSTKNLAPAAPLMIRLDDFNQDHRLDIVVTNRGQNNVAMLLGLGDGNFTKSKLYSTGAASSIACAVGDINHDDRLDLFVLSDDTDAIDILFGYFEGFSTTNLFTKVRYPEFVTVADFNNDNRLDLIVTYRTTNNLSVFLGFGNGSFQEKRTYSTGSYPKSACIGDFNNDTILDIVVANTDSGDISVFLGYGDGSFRNQTRYSAGIVLRSIVAADLNNDHQLDIIVTNGNQSDINILLGYGNGSFQTPITHAVGLYPQSVATGHFNDDDWLDLVVANALSNDISILLGFGNGSFQNQIKYASGSRPVSVAVSDFNQDHRLDMVVANQASNDVQIFLGLGDGSFQTLSTYSVGNGPVFVCVGDMNNDSRIDLIVLNLYTDDISILFGEGNGTFGNEERYAADFNPRSLVVADLNNDQRLDMIAANQLSHDLSILLQYNRGALKNEETYASGGGSRLRFITVGDVNADTHQDIIVANYGTNDVNVLLGRGDGSFKTQPMFNTGVDSHPSFVLLIDFNNDSKWDLVSNNAKTRTLDILLGNGDGTFILQKNDGVLINGTPLIAVTADLNDDGQPELLVAYQNKDLIDIFTIHKKSSFVILTECSTGSSPRSVAIADFNKDGLSDLAVANFWDDNISILLGYGNGSFHNQITYSVGTSPQGIAVGDFNQDQWMDIVVCNTGSHDISILFGYVNGAFQNQTTYTTGRYPKSVAVSDFNQDNRMDIVVVNRDSNSINVFLGLGNGSFQMPTTYLVGTLPMSVAIGDLNQDNKTDIVVANQDSKDLSILFGYGNGSFQPAINYSINSYPQWVAVGDFNNDRRLDIVTANYITSDVRVFLVNVNGSFDPPRSYPVGSFPETVAVGDLNNDNQTDLVVGNYESGDISILLGYGNGSFQQQSRYSTGSSAQFVGVGDFNNDHQLEIIVSIPTDHQLIIFTEKRSLIFRKEMTLTNGNDSRPQSFAVGDFNHDTRLDIAIADSQLSSIAIFYGYGNLSFTNPLSFLTVADLTLRAIATGDFNRDHRLDIAAIYQHTNQMYIFLGDAHGSFSHHSSYFIGIDSNPYSISVTDFNQDQFLDIAIADHAINRISLLFGDGNGTFENLTLVPLSYGSQPFALIAVDMDHDNKTDLVVANEGTDSVDIRLQTC